MPLSKFEKIIAIWMVILTTITTISVIYPILTEQSPNTIAYETFERDGDNEIYKITIYNKGKIAHNLRIEIDLPSNTTYIKLEYIGSESTKTFEDIDENRNYYYLSYSSIQENEQRGIRMILQNNDLKSDSSLLIKPYTSVWTDEEGEIKII